MATWAIFDADIAMKTLVIAFAREDLDSMAFHRLEMGVPILLMRNGLRQYSEKRDLPLSCASSFSFNMIFDSFQT